MRFGKVAVRLELAAVLTEEASARPRPPKAAPLRITGNSRPAGA